MTTAGRFLVAAAIGGVFGLGLTIGLLAGLLGCVCEGEHG